MEKAMEKIDRPNTLIVTVPGELTDLSESEFVDKLVSSLGADALDCVQFVPNGFVRITFKTFDARNKAFLSGIHIESTRLYAVEADPIFRDIRLEHLPVEVPDDAVKEAFAPFGSVKEITHLKFAATSIRNGTRLLKVALASDVPVNLRILRYPCRVYYKGQPRPCSICRSSGHVSFDCPMRDLCRICLKSGHFAADCPANGDDGNEDGDDDDDDDDGDEDYVDVSDQSGDDDFCEDDDVLASGDEEVISAPSAAGPVTRSQSLSVPASSPQPVPMDTGSLHHVTRPLWVKRLPNPDSPFLSAYSSDAHVSSELYSTGSVDVIFDFGRLTYRVLKETRYPEEDRFYAYLTRSVDIPIASSFATTATNLPPLSSDVAPAVFPSSS